jgi:hypothetical protein
MYERQYNLYAFVGDSCTVRKGLQPKAHSWTSHLGPHLVVSLLLVSTLTLSIYPHPDLPLSMVLTESQLDWEKDWFQRFYEALESKDKDRVSPFLHGKRDFF